MASLEEIKALKDSQFWSALSVGGRKQPANTGQGHGFGHKDFSKTNMCKTKKINGVAPLMTDQPSLW